MKRIAIFWCQKFYSFLHILIIQIYHFLCLTCSQWKIQHNIETLKTNARLEQFSFSFLRKKFTNKKNSRICFFFSFSFTYWMSKIKLSLENIKCSHLNLLRAIIRAKRNLIICVIKFQSQWVFYRRFDTIDSRFVHLHDVLRVNFNRLFF